MDGTADHDGGCDEHKVDHINTLYRLVTGVGSVVPGWGPEDRAIYGVRLLEKGAISLLARKIGVRIIFVTDNEKLDRLFLCDSGHCFSHELSQAVDKVGEET